MTARDGTPLRRGPSSRRRVDWTRAGIAFLLSALIVTLGPPVPLLILLPVLALGAVGRWQHVAAVVIGIALLTLLLVDEGTQLGADVPVAVTVLAAGAGVTLVAWLWRRYHPSTGSRHVADAWLQTAQDGVPLREETRLAVTQGATVLLWLPSPGGARLITVTAPHRRSDIVRRLQPLLPLLPAPTPLDVAADAVREVCREAGDGALLLDIGAARQVALVLVGGASAVLVGEERLDLLTDVRDARPTRTSVRRHSLPSAGRLVVLAGVGSLSPTSLELTPSVGGLPASAAARRLLGFAVEVGAPRDAVVLFDLTPAESWRTVRRRRKR